MKRAGVLCVLVAAASLAAGCSEFNREATESNAQGMQFLRANRYADAREQFQRAAEEDRRYALPLYNLALSYIRQHDWPNAIDALSRAISRDPNRPEYYYQLGNAHFQIATDPANAESAEGGAHFDAARTAFQNAIQHDAHNWKSHYMLAQVAEFLDDAPAAMRAYTDTLQMAPRAYGAYSRLGALYRRNHFDHEAEQVLREGLRVAPMGARERSDMHNTLGLTLLDEHQPLPATEEFLASVHEDPEHVDALFSLGMTYADMADRRPQAILYLTQFISARGGNAPPEYLSQAQDRLGALQNPPTAQ